MTNEEDNESLTPRQFFSKLEQDKSEYLYQWAESNKLSPKIYINKGETYTAYGHVLDTGDRAIPTLEYVAELYGKDDDWIDQVKKNPVHADILRSAIRDFEKHPTAQLMKDKDLATPAHKRSLKASQSVSAMLNALSDNVRVARRVEKLEREVDELKSVVILLAEQGERHEERISNAESDIQMLNKNQLKEKALQLHKAGYNYKQIGEALNKHHQTISNWIKDMEV